MSLQSGSKVSYAGHIYALADQIGEGGFARTFLAINETMPTGRKYVVKVPLSSRLSDPTWCQKFIREARILANIKHRNVAASIAFWEFEDGRKALLQEYVEDAQSIDKYVECTPKAAPSLLLQALYALRAFHVQTSPAAVHRDLSPSNILVSNAGVLKVIDFGLAKEYPRGTATLTIEGASFGTMGCIAPEQLNNPAHVDHRADLYSLGKTFASAIIGPEPMFVHLHELDEPWRTICIRLTRPRPDDRYPSAELALEDVVQLFASHRLPIMNFALHVDEMRFMAPKSWAHLAYVQLTGVPIDMAVIEQAAALETQVFQDTAFGATVIFDRFDASAVVAKIVGGSSSFEDGDPFGELYGKLYPLLDVARKIRCFEQLCKAAVELHRYSIMGCIRSIFRTETDPWLLSTLAQRLDQADPERVVHGHGAIPGRG